MTAASRQCGAEGPGGSVGLEVMPIDSVTLSDGYGRGERAPTRLMRASLGLLESANAAPNGAICAVTRTAVAGGDSHAA